MSVEETWCRKGRDMAGPLSPGMGSRTLSSTIRGKNTSRDRGAGWVGTRSLSSNRLLKIAPTTNGKTVNDQKGWGREESI